MACTDSVFEAAERPRAEPPDRTRLTLPHFTATSMGTRVAFFARGQGRLQRVVRRKHFCIPIRSLSRPYVATGSFFLTTVYSKMITGTEAIAANRPSNISTPRSIRG